MDGWMEIDEQLDGWVGEWVGGNEQTVEWMDGVTSQFYSILLLLEQTRYEAFAVVRSRSWEKAQIHYITMLQ